VRRYVRGAAIFQVKPKYQPEILVSPASSVRDRGLGACLH